MTRRYAARRMMYAFEIANRCPPLAADTRPDPPCPFALCRATAADHCPGCGACPNIVCLCTEKEEQRGTACSPACGWCGACH